MSATAQDADLRGLENQIFGTSEYLKAEVS